MEQCPRVYLKPFFTCRAQNSLLNGIILCSAWATRDVSHNQYHTNTHSRLLHCPYKSIQACCIRQMLTSWCVWYSDIIAFSLFDCKGKWSIQRLCQSMFLKNSSDNNEYIHSSHIPFLSPSFQCQYLGFISMVCFWCRFSRQRFSIVNRGLLGWCVGGVDDYGPLGATAVFTAAGLVSLAASIPRKQNEQMHSERTGWCRRNKDI